MVAPNEASVRKAIGEHDQVGPTAFLDTHSSGRPPRAHYLSHEGKMYPLKALWAAAHRPPIHTREFQTANASRGLRKLGFTNFVTGELAHQYEEGRRTVREIEFLSRNPQLVADAKAKHGVTCVACGFNFEATYGALGAGYIECHHLNPLADGDGASVQTSLEQVTVLCANCHRVVHRHKPPLDIAQLRAAISKAASSTS